jgi:putative phosphoribosyl transferase
MMERFIDRHEAGKLLAQELSSYKGAKDTLVLALPRGGVPIAVEIAKALDLPMDLMLVRKLGVPGQEELAMGALAMHDVCFLNDDLIRQIGISKKELDAAVDQESKELQRRNDVYRSGRRFPDLKNQTVILVDDGIATGADMRAAVRAARDLGASRIVVAVPVAADSAHDMLAREADKVVSLLVPPVFFGVGSFYDDFSQMNDDEVVELMSMVRH